MQQHDAEAATKAAIAMALATEHNAGKSADDLIWAHGCTKRAIDFLERVGDQSFTLVVS